MAMTMTGEMTLPADRPKVWELLNDPEVLKSAIPGCESLEKTGDNGFAAVVKTKIGPVSATFKGKVELSDIVPLVGYTIKGEGEGGVAGFAKGGAKVSLADAPGGTLLNYDVEATCRRQDGPARLAPDRRRRQEHGRQIFRQFRCARRERARRQLARPSRPPSPRPSRRPSRACAAPAPQAPATKTSWFRRIWEWFMSLWR